MLLPICINDEKIRINSFGLPELKRFPQLAQEIYEMFSDEDILRFIPEKRLTSVVEAENWLKGTVLNYHCGLNYLHFVTDKASGKLLGMIDIVSPKKAKDHYRLSDYPYFIEFYLVKKAQGRKVMTGLLPRVINELLQRKITRLCVVIDRKNYAALKVAINVGFEFYSLFDKKQDLYHLPLKATA